MATLPATNGATPVVGLLAHVDTSPDAPGDGVEPIVHRAYAGGPIELPRDDTVLDPATMPELADKQGHDIVTSSGDTLLGADDKAGVAEIMAAVAHLAAHPELPRPTLRIGFTPDEEIGQGASRFDVERFGAVCAYTMDGSDRGRAAGRDVHRRRGDHHDPRGRRAPGLRHRQARQRRAARRRGCSPRCPPSSRRRPRPGARASSTRTSCQRHGRAGRHPRDRARLRRRPARAHVALLRAHRRGGRRRRAARAGSRSTCAASTPTCARTSSPSRRSSRRPSARSAPRASSRCGRRSAAAPTARCSARWACRRRTSSPAATSTTRCASGPRCRTWPRRRRRSCGWPRCGPQR